jgi:hypothetical protein
MAKNLVRQYVFAPGAAGVGTIRIPGRFDLSQILLITNTTRNQIIYSFADAAFAGSTATFVAGDDATNFPRISQRVDGYTIITLAVSTVGQLAGDRLQILTEEKEVIFRPYQFGTDAIERMRVSNPQSLIDADFEYGLQPTKWAGYGLLRGYPSIYEFPGVDLTVSTITTNGASPNSTITINTTANHGITAGQAINITSLSPAITGFSRADGNFIVATASGTSITYFATGVVGTNGQSLLTDVTVLKRGNLYTGASLNVSGIASNGATPSVITLTFASKHGLVPGTPIYVNVASGTNVALATGPFFAETVPSDTTLTYTARTGAAVTSPATATVYAIANTSVIHRSFDGGVLLTCKSPAFGASAVRVSKKYFRYQSGKGLLWSTGTLLRPSYDIQTLSAGATTVGATITCKTDDVDHGLQVGASVTISGVTTSGYNGTYTVNGITDDYTFTFLATSVLGSTSPVLDISAKVTIAAWHGGVVRAGCFDDQNGMFWEFNGTTLAVVRRNATQQLSGTIAINANSNAVTGTNTRFTSQVRAGDKIVIRGMTHYVTQVSSNTSMNVNPDFRGTSNIAGAKASLVQETRIPQSQFNIDKLDGTGPSGFVIDTGKMHMLGLQYTWYGAGFIDYMVRGGDGNWVFAHRIKNNNVNTEAHMRTGNLPVRYSIDNDGSPQTTFLTADPGSGGTTLNVNDTTYFPSAGTLYIDNELISYTGKTATSFTGCGRAATLSQYTGGSTRSFTGSTAATHAVGVGVLLVSNTASPTLSHWGSALICDGGFDEDRGYIFNYQRTALAIGTTAVTAFLIRLAPSVSNAAVGDLGAKDLLNRSQLLLNAVGIQTYGTGPGASQGSVIVEGVLNPKNFTAATWQTLNLESQGGQPSLAQVATSVTWASGTFAVPGEQVFAFAATPNSDDRLDLTALKELTNSPFGGVGAYPNGPDILAINVRTVSGTTAASVLLRWGEAQA